MWGTRQPPTANAGGSFGNFQGSTQPAGMAGQALTQSHAPRGKTTYTNNPSTMDPFAGAAPATKGTQSGPGILENWFNQRATGTDPGWEYGMGRASDAINRQYAARGGYNSSGAMQSLGDMYANAQSQREGQLDTLAAGASGEHQRRLEDMFGQGLGLANGQAGAGLPYDMGAGGAMANAQRTKMDLFLGKAGVDQKTRQGQLDAILSGGKTFASILGGGAGAVPGGGGGGGAPSNPYYYGDGLMQPTY